jgi:hypothetical protein
LTAGIRLTTKGSSGRTEEETDGMKRTRILLIAVGMVLLTVPLAEAGTVILGWDANTEADLAGYNLYYGNSPRDQGSYTQTVPINNKDATTWELSLPNGTYYFALTAVDLVGNESGFSNEVSADVSDIGPLPGQPGQPIFIQ